MLKYYDVTIVKGQICDHNNDVLRISKSGCNISIDSPRNAKHHRMVFKMLSYVVDNMNPREGITKPEHLLLQFKHMFKHYDVIPNKTEDIKNYHSFNFHSMSEDKYRPIADQIKKFCYRVLSKDLCSNNVIQGLLDIEF